MDRSAPAAPAPPDVPPPFVSAVPQAASTTAVAAASAVNDALVLLIDSSSFRTHAGTPRPANGKNPWCVTDTFERPIVTKG